MDYELAKLVLMIVNILLTLLVWINALSRDKDKATISSINRVEEGAKQQVEALNHRVSILEQDRGGLLTHAHAAEIYERINDVSGTVNTMSGELKQISNQLSRMQDWMMKRD